MREREESAVLRKKSYQVKREEKTRTIKKQTETERDRCACVCGSMFKGMKQHGDEREDRRDRVCGVSVPFVVCAFEEPTNRDRRKRKEKSEYMYHTYTHTHTHTRAREGERETREEKPDRYDKQSTRKRN